MASQLESVEEQVLYVLRCLDERKYARGSQQYAAVLKWLKHFPATLEYTLRDRLKQQACWTFDVTESQLLADIEGVVIQPRGNSYELTEEGLRAILPKGGYFEYYDEFTRYNEGPLSYHILASLCILGSALGRRVWFPMGHFNIWPNYCAILVGPTGKVKKTTVADIAKEFILRHSLCPVMSDEPSPQALATDMVENGGHQFVYAGEMSLFFSKDKFKENMIPKFLRLLDSPESIEVNTIARGKETIQNLAVSFLGGTTPSLFSTMPDLVTSSGFMNRFVFINERGTSRIFPRPWKGDGERQIDETIDRIKNFSGMCDFADGVERRWWNPWYHERRKYIDQIADEMVVEVSERLPGHLLRTATLIHLVQCDNLFLCEKCLEHARALLEYTEKSTVELLNILKKAPTSQDTDMVLSRLISLGGAAEHSTLLRKVSNKMNAQKFKDHIRTLEEQGKIRSSRRGGGQYYVLIGGGEDNAN